MRTFVAVTIACLAAAAAVTSADKDYSWAAQNGAFAVDQLSMTTSSASWDAGVVATVSVSGVTSKQIIAGTLRYQLWEAYVEQFVQQGSFAYFQCDNKGCDPAAPLALHLTNPTGADTSYVAEFSFTMPRALATGDFRLVVWGQDQDHYPYDFSATVNYNYTFSETPVAVKAQRALAQNTMPYSYTVTDAAFTINTVALSTASGNWGPGEKATVVMTGSSNKVILAGTIKYQVYELGQQYFVAQGDSEYFDCDNKGCNVNKGISLFLADPHATPSTLMIKFDFVMPKAQSTGDFQLVVWGQDQDHFPYDFDATVSYNFTMSATTAAVAAPRMTSRVAGGDDDDDVPSLIPGQIQTTPTNGNFTIVSTTMSTSTGTFIAGNSATIVLTGECLKNIVAGTVQYQFYEQGVQHFTASGNSPYFTCNNKGCDRSQPIALTLGSLTAVPTSYSLTFTTPLPAPQATGIFNLVAWGVDQDHTPYDFDITIQYNTTTTATAAL